MTGDLTGKATTWVEMVDSLVLEDEVARLRHELQDAHAQLDLAARERDEARAEVASTRADLHLGLKTNAAMQDEIDRLRALLTRITAALDGR